MMHVLTTVWHVYPGMVIALFMLIALAIAAIPALVIAWFPSKVSDLPIDDYVYRAKRHDTTLIDTKAEWSYQPQTVNLRGK